MKVVYRSILIVFRGGLYVAEVIKFPSQSY
jgi:hypothetical protein